VSFFDFFTSANRPPQTRLKTMNDIPSAAPYLFVRPDYTTDEAKQMAAQIPSKDLYSACLLSLPLPEINGRFSGW
jgi:hypothetical protein